MQANVFEGKRGQTDVSSDEWSKAPIERGRRRRVNTQENPQGALRRGDEIRIQGETHL